MFDYHLHSKLSFDSREEPARMVEAAEKAGLKEICFTDHYDFNDLVVEERNLFSAQDYENTYGSLSSKCVEIRHGVEAGLTHWNKDEIKTLVNMCDFDFVLGSVHFAGGFDPYAEKYWLDKDVNTAFETYLLQTLKCVRYHEDFDALGHLNYVCKSAYNPTKKPLYYADYRDLCDEIMKVLVQKGKGMEINTSGVDRSGDFLPSLDFLKRFRELGGEIVTIGSDAHDSSRVGQYAQGALALAKEAFGHICTYEKRKIVFHKL